ncbi:MAG: ferric reductase-like transmembrane domain-containing protein, partial [Dehalococcoidia bacterium]|nr:ferric reductase-like transmembrane domain-containing protein [Dehalococcoidia bacterium]
MAGRTAVTRVLVHVALLLPLALLVWDFTQNQLTANPIEAATRRTGRTALVLLMLSLACAPAFRFVRFRPLQRLGRTLGLYAFAYACVHLAIFTGIDYGFDLGLIQEGVLEKRYALAGLSAFLILTALALTSTNGWRMRLGRKWLWLHRAAYLAALVAVVHFFWGVKIDRTQPLQYGAVVLLLVLLRLPAISRLWEAGVRRWRFGGR